MTLTEPRGKPLHVHSRWTGPLVDLLNDLLVELPQRNRALVWRQVCRRAGVPAPCELSSDQLLLACAWVLRVMQQPEADRPSAFRIGGVVVKGGT